MNEEPLFVVDREDARENKVSLISRPAVLVNVSGEMKDAKRYVFTVIEAPKKKLFVHHERGSALFELDGGRPLHVDDVDQNAFFMSRGVLYEIREMSDDEAQMFKGFSNF